MFSNRFVSKSTFWCNESRNLGPKKPKPKAKKSVKTMRNHKTFFNLTFIILLENIFFLLNIIYFFYFCIVYFYSDRVFSNQIFDEASQEIWGQQIETKLEESVKTMQTPKMYSVNKTIAFKNIFIKNLGKNSKLKKIYPKNNRGSIFISIHSFQINCLVNKAKKKSVLSPNRCLVKIRPFFQQKMIWKSLNLQNVNRHFVSTTRFSPPSSI